LVGCASSGLQSTAGIDAKKLAATRSPTNATHGNLKEDDAGAATGNLAIVGEPETDAERSAYTNAIASCKDNFSRLNNNYSQAKYVELGLGYLGIVAGAVVVPALAAHTVVSKASVAAWGGISGASNAAQLRMHADGASAFDQAAVYNQAREDLRKGMGAYVDADTHAGRQKALNDMALACEFPALPTVKEPNDGGTGADKPGGSPAPAVAPTPEKPASK
jgi:hypothetical protein